MQRFQMDADQIRAGRERLGLSLDQFAAALDVSAADLRAMEAGARIIPGPVALASQALFDGWRPPHMRAGPALEFSVQIAA